MNKTSALAIALVLCLLATGFFAYRWRQAEKRLTETVAWTHSVMDTLATTVRFPPPLMFASRDSLYWRWVATNAEVQLQRARNILQHQAELRGTVMDEVDIAQLKEQGLDDPPRQLRESLMARADLIPFPGVLGGTMRFEKPFIVLLKPPYAFAPFDDGHIVGSMLVAYSIEPGGRIEWKRLWADLE